MQAAMAYAGCQYGRVGAVRTGNGGASFFVYYSDSAIERLTRVRLPTANRPKVPSIMGKKGGKKKAKKTLTDEEKLLAAEQAVRSRCVLLLLPPFSNHPSASSLQMPPLPWGGLGRHVARVRVDAATVVMNTRQCCGDRVTGRCERSAAEVAWNWTIHSKQRCAPKSSGRPLLSLARERPRNPGYGYKERTHARCKCYIRSIVATHPRPAVLVARLPARDRFDSPIQSSDVCVVGSHPRGLRTAGCARAG